MLRAWANEGYFGDKDAQDTENARINYPNFLRINSF